MRRALVPAVALALPLTWIAIDPSGHPAAQGPTTISVIDVSGDLSSTRVIIENYAKANPQKVKAVNFQRRSEEHTSELQSLAYLVCRLLLEKKKKDAAAHYVS